LSVVDVVVAVVAGTQSNPPAMRESPSRRCDADRTGRD
jgi:hypothetical protein